MVCLSNSDGSARRRCRRTGDEWFSDVVEPVRGRRNVGSDDLGIQLFKSRATSDEIVYLIISITYRRHLESTCTAILEAPHKFSPFPIISCAVVACMCALTEIVPRKPRLQCRAQAPRCAVEWLIVPLLRALRAIHAPRWESNGLRSLSKHVAQRAGTALANLSVDESASMTSRLSYSSKSTYLR
jgi:hypothetical protein